mgnify:CR=1 FL=1
MENPRPGYLAPDPRGTQDTGRRKLHDEKRLCGNKGADMRVINRR